MVTKASITQNINAVSAISHPEANISENPILKNTIDTAETTAQSVNNLKSAQQQTPVAQNMDLDSIKQDFSNIYQQETNKRQEFQNAVNPVTQRDADSEPYGFDVSDKMSILGSALVNFDLGVGDTAMRAVQLFSQFGPKVVETMAIPGGTDLIGKIPIVKKISDASIDFGNEATNYYNREKSRSELVQNAIHSHPLVAELSNLAGNIVATSPFLEGITALQSGSKLTGVAE